MVVDCVEADVLVVVVDGVVVEVEVGLLVVVVEVVVVVVVGVLLDTGVDVAIVLRLLLQLVGSPRLKAALLNMNSTIFPCQQHTIKSFV